MKSTKEEKLMDYFILKRKKKLEIFKEQIINELLERLAILEHQETNFTAREVCELYKISASTLERHVRKGLKFKSSGAKTKRIFSKSEVELYFKNNF